VSKKTSNTDKFEELRRQRQELRADQPPVMAKLDAALATNDTPPPPAEPPVALTPAKPRPAQAARPSKPAEAEREKTSVYLTGSAAAALRRLQAFLMIDCDAGTTGVAAVINVAIELAAQSLPDNRSELMRLLAETRQSDKRRRSAE
jgi:hypothetical protein